MEDECRQDLENNLHEAQTQLKLAQNSLKALGVEKEQARTERNKISAARDESVNKVKTMSETYPSQEAFVQAYHEIRETCVEQDLVDIEARMTQLANLINRQASGVIEKTSLG